LVRHAKEGTEAVWRGRVDWFVREEKDLREDFVWDASDWWWYCGLRRVVIAGPGRISMIEIGGEF
jgi:hypothetical protein